MHIIDLPDDVLLHIALDLSIQDILLFKQTCRVLHTFGSADYLWHRLAERCGLLLNIPAETSIAALSADELQRIVIDAMRLEVNWTRPSPTIKRTISLQNEDNALFEHLQFVDGAKWLLVVQDRYHRFEERVYTKVAFWSLHNISDPRCVVQFELSGKYRASDVTLNSEEENATFALALTDARGDFLEIRTFSLNDEYAALSQITPFPSVARRIDLPSSEELELCNMSITGLSVSGKVLAATVTVFTLDHHEASRILVARTDKGPAYWMGQQPYKPIHPALARLHKNDIIIFGHTAEGLACHTFKLPSILLRDYSPFMPPPSLSTSSDTALAWGPLVGEDVYTGSRLNTLFPEPKTVPPVSSQTLAFVVVSDSQANLVRFPLNTRSNPNTPSTSSEKPRSHPLPVVLRPDTSIRLVGVGSSGRRAVWMEHDLETTRNRLMRLEVPHDNGVVGCTTDKVMYKVLLPPDPPLPFSTDACQALAFDEASCRLCFGLWDGSLHVVDFL